MGVQLTERLTGQTEKQLATEFRLGEKAAAALEVQEDLSTFLDPPADEAPDREVPSIAEQQKMLLALVNFVTATLKHMPDYLAVRTTKTYADFPITLSDYVFQSGLHSMGTIVQESGYRNGHEVVGKALGAKGSSGYGLTQPGLSSNGEFGQDLGVILSDALHGRITWSHWEQTPTGPAAVFDYKVTKAGSHFMLNFCCGWSPAQNLDTSFSGTPAYHGTIAIDPVSGAIVRSTLEADFEGFYPRPLCNIAVDYGPVEIEGRRSILPIRSVAIGDGTTTARNQRWRYLFVNDVQFSGYHRFGSTMKILTGPGEP